MRPPDGKEAASSATSLLATVGKLVIALKVLYAVNEKFPSLFPKIKAGALGVVGAMMKIGPMKKVADAASASWQKLGEKFPKIQAGIKGTGSALGKIPSLLMAIFGGASKLEQVTGLLLAIGAPAIAAGLLGLAAAATAAGAALARFMATRFADAAQINDLADALDTSASRIQALKLAATATTAKFEDVSDAILNIQKAISKALSGSDNFADYFQQLGFSLEELKAIGHDPEQIFIRISQAVKDGRLSAVQHAAALKVMGDAYTKLKPAMKDNLAELSGAAQALSVDDATLKSLDDVNTSINSIWAALVGISKLAASKSLGPLAASLGVLLNPSSVFDSILSGPPQTAAEQEEDRKRRFQEGVALAAANELKALKEKNQEKEREVALDQMSAKERKAALQSELDGLQARMNAASDAIEKEKLYKQFLEVEGQLANVSDKKTSRASGETRSTDSLTKIGLFRGGVQSPEVAAIRQQVALQQKQLTIQHKQNDALQRQLRRLESIDRGINEE